MKSLKPNLRFPEFNGDWKVKKISDADIAIIDGDRGENYPNGNDFSTSGYCLFLNAKNVTKRGFSFEETSFISAEKDKLLRKGKLSRQDIVLTTRGSIGNIAYYDENIPYDNIRINSGMVLLRPDQNTIKSIYLNILTQSIGFSRQVERISFGSAQPQLTVAGITKIRISVPALQEQEKIAEFLTAVDDRVAAQQQKVELLKKYKKGVMQKIFTQQIRFNDENGQNYPDWQEKRLNDVFERMTYKNKENNQNVLTISAQQGLVSQTDYFNKIVAAKNVTGYYLLQRDDFAYNKSYSAGYPMGAIKRLKYYDKGIVSTLYICFRAKDKRDVDFFEHAFDFGLQNSKIEEVAQEGARNHGLLNIGVGDFFDIELLVPNNDEEQQKIADFLTSLDDKIQAEEAKLTAAKTFKKGLLQRMFV